MYVTTQHPTFSRTSSAVLAPRAHVPSRHRLIFAGAERCWHPLASSQAAVLPAASPMLLWNIILQPHFHYPCAIGFLLVKTAGSLLTQDHFFITLRVRNLFCKAPYVLALGSGIFCCSYLALPCGAKVTRGNIQTNDVAVFWYNYWQEQELARVLQLAHPNLPYLPCSCGHLVCNLSSGIFSS